MNIGTISLKELNEVKSEITDFDSIIQNQSKQIMRFVDFSGDFPNDVCSTIVSLGKTPIISWIPEIGETRRECDPDDNTITHILQGRYDDYIIKFALEVKSFGHKICIDFLHEFNAGWYTWSGKKNGANKSATDKVIKVWKYVVQIFRDQNVTNVKWVWTVHEDSYDVPKEDWNHISNYWPGEGWVDIVGIDGFNFYPENPERDVTPYMSFYQCFNKMYKEVESLNTLPIMIMTGTGEFSYKDKNKPLWIEDMFQNLKENFPRIKSVNWFNYKYSDKIDWRINSSEETLNSWINSYRKNFN